MKSELTADEIATNLDTMRHIRQVGIFLHRFAAELLARADNHDQSKLVSPEVELFTQVNKDLKGLTYDSPEYRANLEKLKPALDHHYANNRHHPAHFKNGLEDMNLIDIGEMFCDWKASSMRHADGNLRTSIEKNAKKYEMSPQLVKIFENTIDLVDE